MTPPARSSSQVPSPHALPLHVRTIRVDAIEATTADGQPALRVQGSLEDRRPRGAPDWIQHDGDVIHDMQVILTVAWPAMVITSIEGRMRTFPYAGVCPEALPGLQSLVGLAIGRGFTRAVNERIGRQHGCTHVTALIQAMGPVVRQGAGVAYGFTNPDAPKGAPWFINSCQAWREDGPLHRAWQRREIDTGR
jgi:hypothetical protein